MIMGSAEAAGMSPPAGFWHRYVAYSLDFTLLGVASTMLGWSSLKTGWRETARAMTQLSDLLARELADAMMQGAAPAQLSARLLERVDVQRSANAVQAGLLHMWLPWLLCYIVLAAIYHVASERSPWQGSPGKRALRLFVVDARHASRASLSRIVVRHFAGALSWLTFNLGHALAAAPPQKRALHDYLSGTRVCNGGGSARLPGWAKAWLALQLIVSAIGMAWLMQRCIAALQASPG